MPLSIEGASPSIIQAQGRGSVFNRPQSYAVKQAREQVRTASIETADRLEQVALRTTMLFLDAERAAGAAQVARRQIAHLERVAGEIALRVQEGRQLEIDARRAQLDFARAKQRAQALELDAAQAEASLAAVLGLEFGIRVRAGEDSREIPPMPPTEEAAIAGALAASQPVRKLESQILAKTFEVKANRAAWLPTVDLVAQYALLGRFNNYEDFFQRFERHNGQIGVSFTVPLYAGTAPSARAAQAQLDSDRLRLQMNVLRQQISLDTRKSFQDVRRAETAAEVARLDLDVAREQVSVLTLQMEEGRVPVSRVEEAGFHENEKWLQYLDARYALERARYALLHHTGSLVAALRR
jgi:outer membrane protein